MYERIQPGIIQNSEQLFGSLSERDRAKLADLLRPVRERAATLLGVDKKMRLVSENHDANG